MTRRLLLSSLLIVLIHLSCEKNHFSDRIKLARNFQDSVSAYLKSSIDEAEFEKLNFTNHRLLSSGTNQRFYQVPFKGETVDNNYILVEDDGKTLKGYRVSIQLSESNFNGILSSEPLDGSEGTQCFFKNGIAETVNKIKKNKIVSSYKISSKILDITDSKKYNRAAKVAQAVSNGEDPQPETDPYTLPPVVVIGRKPSSTTPYSFSSLFWATNQNVTNHYSYTIPSTTNGGSAGSSNIITVGMQGGKTPTAPKVDIYEEIRCFINTGQAQYSLSLNIQQPVPGTTYPWKMVTDVGHAFLTLEQINPDGSVLRRNVGFYPANGANPMNQTDVGVWKNNSQTQFDVSLKIKISGSEMYTITNYMKQYQGYDLSFNNCTTMCQKVFQQIGITLPDGYGMIFVTDPLTNSPVIVQSGSNPAVLGEQIRNMNLNTAFPASRLASKTAIYTNSLVAMNRTGGCL